MENILDFFDGSPWLNMIFLILSLISIVLAIIFYIKSKAIKKTFFSKQTFHLIKDNISELKNIEIKYKSIEVNNLSVTKFALWNSGKHPIKNSDIASADPLVIYGNNNVLIYDYEILFQDKANNIKIDRIDNFQLNVAFEFLNYNDGFIVNIYHNGKTSNDIIVRGTIIGTTTISYGTKVKFYTDKLDFFITPSKYLITEKNGILNFIGWLLIIPSIAIIIPFFIITSILDFVNFHILNRTPSKFKIYDT